MDLVSEGGSTNSKPQNAVLWAPGATFLGDPLHLHDLVRRRPRY
jgi:hypothetical protein